MDLMVHIFSRPGWSDLVRSNPGKASRHHAQDNDYRKQDPDPLHGFFSSFIK